MNEIRVDPVSGEWALFADHRYDRPDFRRREFCPFCPPGSGEYPSETPRSVYDAVVFDNQFPSLVAAPSAPSVAEDELYRVLLRQGAAEVVVILGRPGATLRHLPLDRVRHILDVWCDRYVELARGPMWTTVLIFENRRPSGGATIEHPHAQIYCYPAIPPRRRSGAQGVPGLHRPRRQLPVLRHRPAGGGRRDTGRRREPGFLAVVPFCARWPFEVHVLPAGTRAVSLISTEPERTALAGLLQRVITAYDGLFGMALPYVMAVHQAPTDGQDWEAVSHFHIELMPTQRTADRHKVMAGSELGAGVFVSEMSPEEAADRIRAVMTARVGEWITRRRLRAENRCEELSQRVELHGFCDLDRRSRGCRSPPRAAHPCGQPDVKISVSSTVTAMRRMRNRSGRNARATRPGRATGSVLPKTTP